MEKTKSSWAMESTTNFSVFEVRLISSLLSKKSDDDIAMILERPVVDVREKIHSMTGGISSFQEKVLNKEKIVLREKEIRRQKQLAKEQERIKKQQDKIKKPAQQERKEFTVTRKPAANAAQPSRRIKEKIWPTRVQDFSLMIPVRVDQKTTIYVRQGEDPDESKNRYLKRIEQAKAVTLASYRSVHVKKFKPVQ